MWKDHELLQRNGSLDGREDKRVQSPIPTKLFGVLVFREGARSRLC